MLDTIEKIFEQVVAKRLRKHFWGKLALSANHYGFRAGCSMIDGAGKLKKLTASAIQKRQFGTVVRLDIYNTFNSMPCMHILAMLLNAKVPVYLRNIIREYFQGWMVFVQTASGMVKKKKKNDLGSAAKVRAAYVRLIR